MDLRFFARVMAVAENTSLKLKPPKCALVPLQAAFSQQHRDSLPRYLAGAISSRATFEVENQLLYLGMRLGPAATATQSWAAP